MTARDSIRKATQMLLGIALLGGMTACSDSTTDPDGSTPFVVSRPADDDAVFDTNTYKRSCLTSPTGSPTPSPTCPVVQWEGYEYWALSYQDNRNSFAIHAYDLGGNLLDVVERSGARYIFAIDVEDDSETVTFRGQDDNRVTMTWEELRDLR